MRHPFFFFNADTDCPHYLLGWVREPGMALEPSPERRSNMNTQTHRTCIRMSQEEYDLLKKKSRAAGLSANAWLMRELERNRPMLYREEETRAAIAFADEAGRDINAVARALQQRLRHRPATGLCRPPPGPGGGAVPASAKAGVPLCGINTSHAHLCGTTAVLCPSA